MTFQIPNWIGPKCIGLVFAAIGGAILYFHAIPEYRDATASEKWSTVAGTVTHSKVESTSRSIKPAIEFEYQVNGVNFESDTVWFGGGSASKVRNTVNDFPKFKQVTVYYNPDDPAVAVLLPGVYFNTYKILLIGGLIFFGGVATILITGIREIMKSMPGAGVAADSTMTDSGNVDPSDDVTE